MWAAWLAYRRGKRRRPRVAAFDVAADTHVCRLHRDLRAGRYTPGRYRVFVVRDPKTRVIAAPSMRDRIVHRALLDDIGPTYERGFIDHSYAVRDGRGAHRAILAYLTWTRRYRYRLTLDVRRYFASIRHAVLLDLFARRLRDPATVDLLRSLIVAGGRIYRTPVATRVLGLDREPVPAGCGMPLGGYLSHWSGGLYLDGLDHFIKRELEVRGYLRYMDDLALFGDQAAALEQAHRAISDWLATERGLVLKPGGNVQPTAQPGTYLGMRVSRAGVLPGPKAKRRLRARLRAVDALGPARLERSLRSYRGLLLSL